MRVARLPARLLPLLFRARRRSPRRSACIQVAVDIVHHKTMLELHQKVAPQQIIVGW